VELAGGVALGILVGDAIIALVGRGTLQIMVVVALAMAAAVAIGGGAVLVSQAAVSAVLVATLNPPTNGIDLTRFLDALVGGGIGFAVHTLLLPINPERLARRAAAPVLAELAGVLEDVADGLDGDDAGAVERALLRARGIEGRSDDFQEAVAVGRETARLAPPRWRSRDRLSLYAQAGVQLDLAVRNVRVLARRAHHAVAVGDHVPPELPDALRDLADCVRRYDAALQHPDERLRAAQVAALRAAGRATLVLEQTANMSVNVLVAQVRSTAVDLLRGLGMERTDAEEAVREAARVLREEGEGELAPTRR
jgi:uncharacterized membrane protein YgaE (UPF0421/DUF939 family)